MKTYKNINPADGNSAFAISKMEDIYLKRNGKIDEPHRHNYYTVLIIANAKGFHKIDFNFYALGTHQVFFVAPGQVHQVIETEKSQGYVMTFSSQFLLENAIPAEFIESLNLFQNYGESPPLLPHENQFTAIQKFAEEIFQLFNGDAFMKELSIGSFLKLLLIECNNICSIHPLSTADYSGAELIKNFKKAVEEKFWQEHSTSYYADLLHITPDHLNRVFKAQIGITAKEYIQKRITTEAKRLLYFTELSAKEIGYELGFTEPANFSAFFKKETQLSPTQFKKGEKAPNVGIS